MLTVPPVEPVDLHAGQRAIPALSRGGLPEEGHPAQDRSYTGLSALKAEYRVVLNPDDDGEPQTAATRNRMVDARSSAARCFKQTQERGFVVATYVTLWNYTREGITTIKDSPARLDAVRELLSTLGVELKAFYLTMGAYDLVTISEAPDDETATKAALAIASRGMVRSETLRAYTEPEYRDIIAALP